LQQTNKTIIAYLLREQSKYIKN